MVSSSSENRPSSTVTDSKVDNRNISAPPNVREKLGDAENVTGATFLPPFDLDGYLDEPKATFGLYVGENEEEAELHGFEISADQIQGFAEAFAQLAEDAEKLAESDNE